MKLKLQDILFSSTILRKLASQDMPVRVAYKVGKTIKTLEKDYERVEAKRNELIRELGEKKDEQPNSPMIVRNPEAVQQFSHRFTEYLQEEVEVEIDKICISDLPENIKLTPQDTAALDFLLESANSRTPPTRGGDCSTL